MTEYNVHRSTTAGFTPSAANRIAQPTGTSYTDTGLAAGIYYYKVTAEDAAGNVGPASNEASAAVSGHDAADAPGNAHRDAAGSGRRRSPGAPRPTTSASPATTSTASTTSGFTPARRTGSRSRPG